MIKMKRSKPTEVHLGHTWRVTAKGYRLRLAAGRTIDIEHPLPELAAIPELARVAQLWLLRINGRCISPYSSLDLAMRSGLQRCGEAVRMAAAPAPVPSQSPSSADDALLEEMFPTPL